MNTENTTIAELNARIAALEAEIADLRSGVIHEREGKCVMIQLSISDVKEVRPDLDDAQAFAVLTDIKDYNDAKGCVLLDKIAASADGMYPVNGDWKPDAA